MDTEKKPQKRTLLQKYEIPVEFLDFSYIKTCTDPKMMEKIVKILRSGEEGYYPDLTKCAEVKLKELKPDSKLFRFEEPPIRTKFLDSDKREKFDSEMKSFIDNMKRQDEILRNIKPNENKNEPPIRNEKVEKVETHNGVDKSKRIKSTDYDKWDRFDADAAELKIDLDEERQKEILESEMKKKSQNLTLIEEIPEVSDFERERLAMKFKERGNEAFKAKDYEEAIREYTKSLNMKRSAAAFNNRALVYLKQKCYLKVISDTNECLQLEPQNVKALLRKAQAFIGENLLREAHDTFEKVLQIDSSNEIAQKEILSLKNKLPARESIRMKIEEVEEVKEAQKLDLPEQSHVPELVKNIIVEEPSLFDKFKKKEPSEKKSLILPNEMQSDLKKSKNILIQELN